MASPTKIIEKEQKQLSKLQKMQSQGNYRWYFLVLLFLIAFVNIIDEVTSNLSVTVQSSFITEFFVNGTVFGKSYTYEEGLSLHSTINVLSYAFGVITPFYKALADKWGRKPLFAMSTLGMSIGLLITYFSPNYIVFLVGAAVISFFIGHDIQIIYILEEAPSKSRARIYSVLKTLGILGVVLVPVLRDILMGNDPTLWRRIYLVPGIVGVVACLAVILFAKETKVYIKERSEYLKIPYEVRQAERQRKKQEKKADAQKTGVISGAKYIFSRKDTKNLIIAHIIFDTAIAAIALFFESAMHIAGMSTEDITKALFILPMVYAALTFISGFVADILGRKKTVVAFSVLCAVTFILFAVSINRLWNPYLVGAFCGFYQGSYWIGRDYMNIMMTEKVPTDIRASVVGAEGLLVNIGMAVGYALMTVGIMFLPVWLTCLLVSIPCVTASAVMLALKVKETKGANLEKVELVDTIV